MKKIADKCSQHIRQYTNNDVIQDCYNFLKFSLPSDLLAVRYATYVL